MKLMSLLVIHLVNTAKLIFKLEMNFVIIEETLLIAKVEKITHGFNSTSVTYKNPTSNKVSETTWPAYHAKKILFETFIDAITYIIKHLDKTSDLNFKQRLFEYKYILMNSYPEKLL